MADGYARATGKVGVAMATTGPGATNLVTGIATAMMDSSPMVCITGQVPTSVIGTDAFQEADVTGVTLPITKHNYLVTDGARTSPNRSARPSTSPAAGRPGPGAGRPPQGRPDRPHRVHYPTGRRSTCPGYRPVPDGHRGRRSARRCGAHPTAERPVILAGRGVLLSGAVDELREFAERTETPVR